MSEDDRDLMKMIIRAVKLSIFLTLIAIGNYYVLHSMMGIGVEDEIFKSTYLVATVVVAIFFPLFFVYQVFIKDKF